MALKINRRITSFNILILIIVIVIFGSLIYLIFRGKDNDFASSKAYNGWKSAVLKYEKLKFKYPSNWVLKNVNDYNFGLDYLTLNAPDGFEVQLQDTNIQHPNLDVPQYVLYAKPTTFLGSIAYIDYYNLYTGNPSDYNPKTYHPTQISGGSLSSDSSNILDHLYRSKNIKPKGWFTVSIFDREGSNDTINSIKTNPDFNDAKLIVESMSY